MLAHRLDRLRARYRKTAPEWLALLRGDLPAFVTSADPAPVSGEIPVFTFHDVEPATFDAQLAHLARNGYGTLGGDALRRALAGEETPPPRSVVLTFDDGLASLHDVAHPLLARYGFRGLAFVVSGHVPERREPGGLLCSWEELGTLHAAGTLEIHSHSHHHDRVPVSPEVVDFLHPGFETGFANSKVPASHAQGRPGFEQQLVWGTPVHRSEPRLRGIAPFLDDEAARRACQRQVEEQGGAAFFERPGWRRELLATHRAALPRVEARRYAAGDTAAALIEDDLRASRETIRGRIPGAEADHLCFPWYAGSDLAVERATRVGFRVLHWGIRRDRRTNRPGDDARRVARVDERWLLRLPGEGRRSLRELVGGQLEDLARRVRG